MLAPSKVRASRGSGQSGLDATPLARMAAEIRAGLSAQPLPWLPSKYFYDDRGSALFEQITRLPEYYQTRTEEGILERVAGEVVAATRPVELCELGSGVSRKVRLLLDAGRALRTLDRLRAPGHQRDGPRPVGPEASRATTPVCVSAACWATFSTTFKCSAREADDWRCSWPAPSAICTPIARCLRSCAPWRVSSAG